MCYKCSNNQTSGTSDGLTGLLNSNNTQNKNTNSFIILDLRITDFETKEVFDIKPGFLPMTVILDQAELLSDNVLIE